jgi:hypothetical protein
MPAKTMHTTLLLETSKHLVTQEHPIDMSASPSIAKVRVEQGFTLVNLKRWSDLQIMVKIFCSLVIDVSKGIRSILCLP